MAFKSSYLLIFFFLLIILQGCGGAGDLLFNPSVIISSSIWSNIKQVGSPGFTIYATGVSSDSLGNVYLSGSTNTNLVTGSGASTGTSDIYVSKYNSSGALQFTLEKGISTLNSYGLSVTTDSFINFYISGYTSGNLVTGAGSATGIQDFFVSKYNSSGALQFTKQLGEFGRSTQSNGVAVDVSGNIFVAGNTTGNLVTGSGAATGGGGVFTDAYITKYNSSGTFQFTKQAGVLAKVTTGITTAVDTSGNSYLVGYTTANLATSGSSTGTSDSFAIKYNSAGTSQFTKQLGVAGTITYGLGVATDSSGNFYVAGSSAGDLVNNSALGAGTMNCFIAKYNSGGTLQFVKQFGVSTYTTYCTSVTADSSGNIYSSGYTNANLVSGTGASKGTTDTFMVKYDSVGTLKFLNQSGVTSATTKALSTAVDSSGNIFITGTTTGNLVTGSGSSTGTQDTFLIKYNSSGVQQ